MSNAWDRQRSSGHLAVLGWSTTKVGGAMIKDELRGKPEGVGVHASERLSLTCLGKASRGKPRPKPESGNPTFRDCRGCAPQKASSERPSPAFHAAIFSSLYSWCRPART